jgi:hypothetical protein
MSWQDDKRWSDRFIPEIKRILGEYLIKSAPIEEDMEHNTDLVVLKLDSVRIGCRIRRYNYFAKYPNEITIRSSRPNGCKTELTKIVEGWGDYFFYGFGSKDETVLEAWALCDLRVFRLWFNQEICRLKGRLPGQLQNNGDNSSQFIAFTLDSLPKQFVVARYAGSKEQELELVKA